MNLANDKCRCWNHVCYKRNSCARYLQRSECGHNTPHSDDACGEDGDAYIQAAADRRAKRNAKRRGE